jgi:hypothetical protein
MKADPWLSLVSGRYFTPSHSTFRRLYSGFQQRDHTLIKRLNFANGRAPHPHVLSSLTSFSVSVISRYNFP